MTAGYSGTPLARKLGLKPDMRVWFSGLPASVRIELDLENLGVEEQDEPSAGMSYIHVFCTWRADLAIKLAAARALILPAGIIWASWPKKAAKQTTDLDDKIVRDTALSLGLVDVKVCAVDATWSGLKLMIPQALRR